MEFAYVWGGPFEDRIFHLTMKIDNPRDGNFEGGFFPSLIIFTFSSDCTMVYTISKFNKLEMVEKFIYIATGQLNEHQTPFKKHNKKQNFNGHS